MNTNHYSDEELLEFRRLIEEKLDKARDQLSFCHRVIEDKQENEMLNVTALDEQSSSLDASYMAKLASSTAKYIGHLEKALERIDNKVYGVCRVTGKLISKERLQAVPHATLSIDAKQAQ